MKYDFDKMIESAGLKAEARIKAFDRKEKNKTSTETDELKKKIVKVFMSNPEVLRDLMRQKPREMNDLIQRYG